MFDAGGSAYESEVWGDVNQMASDFESWHNLKYWRLEPYLGLGAGAHSFDGQRRWANETSPEAYSQKLAQSKTPIAEVQRLETDEQLEEFFFLGLRQTEGVDLEAARRRWGAEQVQRWEPIVTTLIERGLIEKSGDQIRLADRACLISNEAFREFLAARAEVRADLMRTSNSGSLMR